MQRTTIISLIIVLVAVAGLWYFLSSGNGVNGGSADAGAAVARVNGEEITRSELEQAETQIAAGQGVDVSSLDEATRAQLREQALNNLVNNALIRQAAERSGVVAADADVSTQLEAIRGQFASVAQFEAALSEQNISEADLRTRVASDLVSERYLQQALDLGSITVTDEEISAMYKQELAGAEDAPPLEDVRAQVEAFILQQKQQGLLAAHIQELRADAEIEILI